MRRRGNVHRDSFDGGPPGRWGVVGRWAGTQGVGPRGRTSGGPRGDRCGDLPITEAFCDTMPALPSHPFLSVAQVDEVADALPSAIGPHAEPVTDRRG